MDGRLKEAFAIKAASVNSREHVYDADRYLLQMLYLILESNEATLNELIIFNEHNRAYKLDLVGKSEEE